MSDDPPPDRPPLPPPSLLARIEVARANLAVAYAYLDDPEAELPHAIDEVVIRRARLAGLVAQLRAMLRAGSLVDDG